MVEQYDMLAGVSNCTGCSACSMTCPVDAISMHEDSEGFARPYIDLEKCIHCGACNQVCPILQKHPPSPIPKAYAARALDFELRRTSSSGGIFYLLGEQIIRCGGVVFGCVLTGEAHSSVRHVCAETSDELSFMKGSKYVQSDLGDCYRQVKRLMSSGRIVLFSGTPCQVMGLKSYLGTQKENLITVTFICHGVPSPAVYKKYLDELKNECGAFQVVSFRDKTFSWSNFAMAIDMHGTGRRVSDMSHDPFLRVFLANLCLRPSCYCCPCQNGRNGADITLGDFWGVSHFVPEMDDGMGTSYVLVHSPKGEELWSASSSLMECHQVQFEKTIQYNRAYFESPPVPSGRDEFMRSFRKQSLKRLGDYLIEGSWYIRYTRRFYYSVRTNIGTFLRKLGVRR